MSTEPGLVYIGDITRPHGVRGELKVLEGLGTSGAWRESKELYIGGAPDDAKSYRVVRIREGGRFAIVALEGVESVEGAQSLRGERVYVHREQLPGLEEGTYYASDLLGLRVEDLEGRVLGELVEIFDNGAHEIYVVSDGATELLLPVVDKVVVGVEPEAGRILVDPPEGLVGLARAT